MSSKVRNIEDARPTSGTERAARRLREIADQLDSGEVEGVLAIWYEKGRHESPVMLHAIDAVDLVRVLGTLDLAKGYCLNGVSVTDDGE